jgi:gluconolactonase
MRPSDQTVRELASGLGFTEGPVVTGDGTIYVTSITDGKVYLVDDDGGRVYGDTGGGANGAVLDGDGTLYVAQNGGRWARNGPSWTPDSVGGLQRIAPGGAVSWVTREPIAPNDLCFGPDGMIYATDPTRAPGSHDGRLWRIDPADGASELLRSVGWFPNGIAFGADGRLYVAATNTARILAFPFENGRLGDEELVIQMERGAPDGMAFDAEGALVIGAIAHEGDGLTGTIQTWSTSGDLLDTFSPGDSRAYTNVAFTPTGDLVIADSSGGKVLLAEGWGAGLPLHPFR